MAVYVNIGGTDYGPHGANVVRVLSFTKGTGSRNGQATIQLVFDYAFAYDIRNKMEVQVYDLVSGTANGIFGGFVVSVDSGSWKGTVKRLVTIKAVDYNVLWDAINLRLASPLTISANTLPNQLTALFHGFQWQGFGSVSKDINTSTYVTNITGATTLPQLVIPGGQTFRQGMRALIANVQVANSALRPRYGLTLESDGAGGVQAALMLVDGAATPTPVAAFAQVPTGGQRSIYDFKRTLDSSMPMVNARQSRWHTAFGDQFASYTNATSGAAYPNPYVNNGLSGAKGYWSDVPLDDKDSQNATDAVNKLTQLVQTVEFPRESTSLTYDKLPAETLFIRVGQAITVTWPPDQLVAAPYTVTGVSIAFPVSSKESYERVTLTLGLPRLELGEDGTDGLTGAPHEIVWAPLPPTGLALDTSYGTSGYTWQGLDRATSGWTWSAPAGRQPSSYRMALHRTDAVQNLFVVVPGDTLSCTVPNMVVGGTYTPSVVAIFNGQESEYDVIANITVPAYVLPAAPTLGTITDSINASQLYAINVPVNHAALTNNQGGWVKVHAPGRGFDTLVAIPAGAPWPTTVTITVPGLAANIAYAVSAQVTDANGFSSLFCTPVSHTCGAPVPPPLTDMPSTGYDNQHPDDDQTIAGWEPISPAVITDFAVDTSVTPYAGQSSLRVTGILSATKEIESPQFYCTPGEVIDVVGASKRQGITGAGNMYVQPYQQNGTTTVGSRLTVFTGVTSASFPTTPLDAKITIPATAYRFSIIYSATGLTSGNYVFFSYPRIVRQIQTNQIALNAVGPGNIAAGGVLPGNTNNGVRALENGSLEIPNTAGTMPAGWDYNNSGTLVYEDTAISGTAGDGTRYVTIGGGVGTHRFQGPMVPCAWNTPTSISLWFRYGVTTLTGATPTFGVAQYDKNKAYISDLVATDPGGGSLSWTAGGAGITNFQRGIVAATSLSASAVYVAPYFNLVVTSGLGKFSIDTIRMDEAGSTIYPQVIQGVSAGGANSSTIDVSGAGIAITASVIRLTTGSALLSKILTATATLDFLSTAAQSSSDLTITLTGAAVGDVVLLGVPDGATLTNSCYTAWVSAANTVKVRFNNYSSGAQNPASATFRVSVVQF